MVMSGVGSEIVIIDLNEALAAQAQDITRAIPFAASIDVRAGGYDDFYQGHRNRVARQSTLPGRWKPRVIDTGQNLVS